LPHLFLLVIVIGCRIIVIIVIFFLILFVFLAESGKLDSNVNAHGFARGNCF